MKTFRLVICLGAAVLGVLAGGPALAAGAFDVEISGPGMETSITVTWDEMARAVGDQSRSEGVDPRTTEYPFAEEVQRPSGSLGPKYRFELRKFIPTYNTPMGTEEWSYFPQAGVFRTGGPLTGEWRKPRTSLARTWNQAIVSGGGTRFAVAEPMPQSTVRRALPSIAVVLMLGMIVAALIRVRKRRATSLQTPSDVGPETGERVQDRARG